MNMNGLNHALGRSAGNEFLRLVSSIYTDELKSLDPSYFYAFRKDGDEMSFILGGVDAADIEQKLASAKSRVDAFVSEAGLSSLRHQKYPHLTGVGIVTATESLKDVKENFESVHNKLQSHITAQKKSLPAFAGVPREVTDYINNSSADHFKKALSDITWNQHGTAEIILPENMQVVARDEGSLGSRQERLQDMQKSSGTLLRADLYNLGGLNAALGPAGADKIIRHMMRIMREEIRKQYPTSKFYDAGAGVIDALIPIGEEKDITDVKKCIHHRLFEEILSKRADEYITEDELKSSLVQPDIILGRLPYKDNTHSGVGIVMSHTGVSSEHSQANTLARLDAIANIQKIHAAAFLERTETGQYKRYKLFPVGKSLDDFDIVDDMDPQSLYALPYANSLKNELTAEDLEAIFAKPCGLICQEIFGIDLTSVFERQSAIQKMIQSGVAQEEIIENSSTLIQFDFWRCNAKEVQKIPVNLLDRQDTVIRSDPRLMTFSLAQRWKVLPEDMQKLPETVLSVQAALRTSQFLSAAVHTAPEDSISYLEKDVRTHMIREENDDLRCIQSCEQAIKALHHLHNYLGDPVPESATSAAATLTRETFDNVIQVFDGYGEHHISLLLQVISNNPFQIQNANNTSRDPESVLQEALKNGIEKLGQRTDLDPKRKESIIGKLQDIGKALSGSRHHSLDVQLMGAKAWRIR